MPQRISGDKVLLSTAEACEMTSFSSAYIARLLRDKRIEGVMVGSVWLIYEDSLQSFIAQPRKRGPKGPHKKPKDHLEAFSDTKHIEKMNGSDKGQETPETQ